MNKSDFDKIIIIKQKNREKLSELKTDLSVLLYFAIVNGKNIKYVIDESRKLCSEFPELEKKTILSMKSIFKKASAPSVDLPKTAFDMIDKQSSFSQFDSFASDWLKKDEARMKDEVLNESLKEPKKDEKIDNFKAFALCSRHDDCAEDHKEWQGKLYVKRWALRYPEIKRYCEANNIKTLEWVTGKPVWMTTRPNCRHFFTDVMWGEVNQKSVTWMLKEHGMDRIAGTKGTWQTAKHSTQKEWYTEQNVLRTIKQYEQRLKKHQKMADIYLNENLKNMISKDKMLIRKWKQYLEKIKKSSF